MGILKSICKQKYKAWIILRTNWCLIIIIQSPDCLSGCWHIETEAIPKMFRTRLRLGANCQIKSLVALISKNVKHCPRSHLIHHNRNAHPGPAEHEAEESSMECILEECEEEESVTDDEILEGLEVASVVQKEPLVQFPPQQPETKEVTVQETAPSKPEGGGVTVEESEDEKEGREVKGTFKD